MTILTSPSPRALAIAAGKVERGAALCGMDASVAANRAPGVHAGLIHGRFSAHQGVDVSGRNVSRLAGKVIGSLLVWKHTEALLAARRSATDAAWAKRRN